MEGDGGEGGRGGEKVGEKKGARQEKGRRWRKKEQSREGYR